MAVKRCPNCGLEKPLEDFARSRNRADGRGSYCRPCLAERSAAAYRRRRSRQGLTVVTRTAPPEGHARCGDCGTERPLDEFPLNAQRPNGRGVYCRECARRRGRQYYAQKRAALGTPVRPREALPAGQRRCTECREVKPTSDFGRNRHASGGHAYTCKPCTNARQRVDHLRWKYGMSLEEARATVAARGRPCALCQERPATHVDHDHESGAVRGLLCDTCNTGLGLFRDRQDLMLKAFDYLRGIPPGSYESALLDLDPVEVWGPEPDPGTGLPR